MELSHVRADARGAGIAARRQLCNFEDAHRWKFVRAFAGACHRAALWIAGFAGERVGRTAQRCAGAQRIGGLPGVCGRKNHGGVIASTLYDENKRYILEMEGVNAYGVWDFSDWPNLAQQLRKGFDYGKQRCTAYVRYVVQRELFPQFLEMYLPVLRSLRFGNPVMVESATDPLPRLDFGPLI
jgi:acyl-CoA reductase-like NAD-dependent aldehyde dehydrogenase